MSPAQHLVDEGLVNLTRKQESRHGQQSAPKGDKFEARAPATRPGPALLDRQDAQAELDCQP